MALAVAITQQKRGPFLKLIISIACHKNVRDKENINEVNIDDLATVRFRFQGPDNNVAIKAEVESKKHATDSMVKIKFAEFDKDLDCADDWSGYTDLDTLSPNSDRGNVLLYVVEVSLVVTHAAHRPPLECKMLYDDKNFTDFNLSTDDGDDGSVPVHKVCLAAHSDVFKTLLSGEWKETTTGCIHIKGLSLQTLNHLKDYMYLGALPEEGLRPLLLIANFYEIRHLQEECILKLASNVTADNLLDLLEFASDNKITDLTVAILQQTPDKDVHSAYKLEKEKKFVNAADRE